MSQRDTLAKLYERRLIFKGDLEAGRRYAALHVAHWQDGDKGGDFDRIWDRLSKLPEPCIDTLIRVCLDSMVPFSITHRLDPTHNSGLTRAHSDRHLSNLQEALGTIAEVLGIEKAA